MKQEIENLIQTYQRGLNENNLELSQGDLYLLMQSMSDRVIPLPAVLMKLVELCADFLSKLDFNIQFEILEISLESDLGFVRTRSYGTVVPKGQPREGSANCREIFLVKRVDGNWKIYLYTFNDDF